MELAAGELERHKQAKELFHGKDGLNCVQAVLKVFQAECGISDEVVTRAGKLGGGRAEGGVCGALYATWMLCGDDDIKVCIDGEFRESAGCIRCKVIRKQGKLSCRECVGLAAELLGRHGAVRSG